VPESKHRVISQQLAADIAAGKYAPGARLPSEAQLTKRYGVSRPTVGRALRDLVVEGVIERRAGSGTYVRIDPVASGASARQIGLLVAGLGTVEIFDLICGELASLARAGDYTLLWGGSRLVRGSEPVAAARALEVCEQFITRRVAGVVFAPYELSEDKDTFNRAVIARLQGAGIPTVLLDRDVTPFPERSGIDLVGNDNVAAGYLIAEHLLKLGCQRLAFVTRPWSAPTVDARLAGVREALARRGIAPVADWVLSGSPDDKQLVAALAKRGRFDAVVCANDFIAAELMRGLEQRKIRVPRDLRIVGFDDAKFATLLRPALTTVHQPCADIALVTYRALVDRIAEPALPPRTLSLAPRLVVRESCGAYR
jgi:LacI family transcriptional regulator